jgi:nucleotide-binding universal stress UspA family protein
VRSEVLKGAPAGEIVSLAKTMPQSIIVMATRGRSGLTQWVLGSVTEAVLRASGEPVLIVPPADAVEN